MLLERRRADKGRAVQEQIVGTERVQANHWGQTGPNGTVPISICSTSSAGKNQHQARDAGRVAERAGIDGVGGYRASLDQGPPRW